MFNLRLKSLRAGTKLTQKEFAEKIGVDVSKYNKWENGKNMPDFETVCKLADELGVTTDYLLGRSGNSGLTDENTLFLSKGINYASESLNAQFLSDDPRTFSDVLNSFLSYHNEIAKFLMFVRAATTSKFQYDRGMTAHQQRAKYRMQAHDILDTIISTMEAENLNREIRGELDATEE